MSLRILVKIINTKTDKVYGAGDRIRALLEDMAETMDKANGG
jgi:peptide deformylase